MNNDQLQKWALIAEIIGGFAVLLTLVLLVIEVNDNTSAIKASTYDSLVADLGNWRAENARSEMLSRIGEIRETEGFEALTPTQQDISNDIIIAWA